AAGIRTRRAAADPGGRVSTGTQRSGTTGHGSVAAADRPPGPAPPASRGYLPEIDVFRLVTFACVIAVHVCSAATRPDNVASDGVQLLLHFTREAFFALTGFVLTFQTLRSPRPAPVFWRRRIPLVLAPYTVWTVVYALLATATMPPDPDAPTGPAGPLLKISVDLVLGTGWYHLYFLLVTLQFYLVFPPLLALLRRLGPRGHAVLVAAALAVQLGMCALIDDPPATPVGAAAATHGYATLPGYLLYPVLGAVAAMHLDRFRTLAHRYRVAIGATAIVVVAATELLYAHEVGAGVAPAAASAVFRPAVQPYYLVIVLALYALCLRVSAGLPDGGPARRVLAYCSDRSFAIFLAHPLVLAALLPPSGPLIERVGPVAGLLGLYLATVAGTVAIAEVLRRLPGSTGLTGRPPLRAGVPGRRDVRADGTAG
ncbi:MAG: acyltransferase, partial [Actinomycetota bacterium]|nr:acyltransferase [Actinomycetota bacterium]